MILAYLFKDYNGVEILKNYKKKIHGFILKIREGNPLRDVFYRWGIITAFC